jgi:hypothetical protein
LIFNFNFKLEEEVNPALLLHLPKVRVETTVSGSAPDSVCRLVVETSQAIAFAICKPIKIQIRR